MECEPSLMEREALEPFSLLRSRRDAGFAGIWNVQTARRYTQVSTALAEREMT